MSEISEMKAQDDQEVPKSAKHIKKLSVLHKAQNTNIDCNWGLQSIL